MTTPDRATARRKRVENMSTDGWSGDAFAVSVEDCLKLLRKERAAVQRIVKEVRQAEVDGLNVRQYLMACDDMLAALAKRGRR